MNIVNTENPVNRSEYIELKITDAAKTRHYFQDQENLRGKKIKIIETFKVANVTKAPSNNALINATAFAFAYLVLVEKGKEAINRMPLINLDPISNYGRRVLLEDMQIDWVKSYIEFPLTTGLVANEVVLFNAYYKE